MVSEWWITSEVCVSCGRTQSKTNVTNPGEQVKHWGRGFPSFLCASPDMIIILTGRHWQRTHSPCNSSVYSKVDATHFINLPFLINMWNNINCYIHFISFFLFFFPPQTFSIHSEQNVSSQATYAKPPPSTTNHIAGGVGGGESSPEEVEVLLSSQKVAPRRPSFLRSLIKAFGPYFLIGSAYKLLQDTITFVNPQLLR